MTSCRYEKLIMILIVVAVVGLLGFSEYAHYQKEKPVETTKVSKQSDMVSYEGVMIQNDMYHDLVDMTKCAGRDRIPFQLEKGYQENGTEEEKTGLLVSFQAEQTEQTKELEEWFQLHAYQYGFIIYRENDFLTYRYVGRKLASTIQEQGVSYSEYFQEEGK